MDDGTVVTLDPVGGGPLWTLPRARSLLARPDGRELRGLLRSAASGDTGDPVEVAREILAHFEGKGSKAVAWACCLDESEATLLLGRLRALAGEVG